MSIQVVDIIKKEREMRLGDIGIASTDNFVFVAKSELPFNKDFSMVMIGDYIIPVIPNYVDGSKPRPKVVGFIVVSLDNRVFFYSAEDLCDVIVVQSDDMIKLMFGGD